MTPENLDELGALGQEAPTDEVELHREMDRLLDMWDEEPTHEKWRKGGRWR